MILPIVSIPPSIKPGLAPYRDLFPRSETYQHILEYCTALVVLDKPSINRLAQCLVQGPSQSSINKALTLSPWSCEALNQRRLEQIKTYHTHKGLRIGVVDSTFSHHPRGEKKIYGVYKYWDYVNQCYTYAMQLVTAAIVTADRCDGFDYRIYHLWQKEEELAYYQHQKQLKTNLDLAAELIEQMEGSQIKPDVYTVDGVGCLPL